MPAIIDIRDYIVNILERSREILPGIKAKISAVYGGSDELKQRLKTADNALGQLEIIDIKYGRGDLRYCAIIPISLA
jgi:hypothetical protein